MPCVIRRRRSSVAALWWLAGMTATGGPSAILPAAGVARFCPDTVLVRDGVVTAIIVGSASDPAAMACAQQAAAGVKEAIGIDIPIVLDDAVCAVRGGPLAEAYRASSAIVVGNLDNNRAFFPLYIEFLAGSDSRYPGGDGYEIRSVCNPWGTGVNVLIIGASGPEGLRAGVGAWLARLPRPAGGTLAFPYTIAIRPGPELKKAFVSADPDTTRQPIDPEAWYSVNPFCEAAQHYYWTGDKRWARRAHDFMSYHNARFSERYPMNDYDMERLYRAWDLIEESPVFTEEERQLAAWHLVETAMDFRQFRTGASQTVGSTHATIPTMGRLVAARWVQRTYPDHADLIKTADAWADGANEYFASAVTHFRDDTDSISYSTVSSIALFMRWAAGNHIDRYYLDGLSRVSLQAAVSTMDSLGYYAGLDTYGAARPGWMYRSRSISYPLQICAFMHDDPYYRWLADRINPGCYALYAQPLFPYGTCTFPPPADAPRRAAGYLDSLTVTPLSAKRHLALGSGKGTHIPAPEQCFDKATFRTGVLPSDAYVLLNGIAHAGDANTIPRYTDRGQIWLVHNTSQIGPYYRNALYLSNGRNDTTPAVAARLDVAARFEDCAIVGTTLTNYYGADWQRTIVWRPGQWFLVLDRALIREAGQYSAQSVWRLPAGGRWDGERELTVNQAGHTLHLISAEPVRADARFESPAGGPPDIHENPFFLRERKNRTCQAGDVLTFQNLFVVTPTGTPSPITPVRQNDASVALLHADGTRTFVLVGADRQADTGGVYADSGVVVVEPDALYLAGTRHVRIDGKDILNQRTPLTARLSLQDGTQRLGHDAAALQAAAYTWRLPAAPQDTWIEPAEARASAVVLAQQLAALRDAPGPAGTDRTQTATQKPGGAFFRKRWEIRVLTPAGRRLLPDRVTCRPEGTVQGRETFLADGLIPIAAGSVTWPIGATADVELTWPDMTALSDVSLIMNYDLFEQVRGVSKDVQVEVQWLTGSGTDSPRYHGAIMHVTGTALPVGKTRCAARWAGVIDAAGVRANGLRLKIPPMPFVRPARRVNGTCISEIQVRAAEPGPLAVHHVTSADLDGDGQCEHLVNAGRGQLVCVNADGRVRWHKTFMAEVSGLDTGDLDGDGKREVLCCGYDQYAYAFSADGQLVWQTDFHDLHRRSGQRWGTGSFGACSTPFSIGFWEPVHGLRLVLVGCYENQLFLLDASGTIVQQYYPGFCMFQRTFAPGGMDMDGDGKAEKVMGSMKYGAYGALLVLSYGTDGIAWHRSLPIPDNRPYALRLHREGQTATAAVVTPAGCGCYNVTGGKNAARPTVQAGGRWERTGRPLSAGTAYVDPTSGAMRLLAAGCDNRITHYDASGQLLSSHQSDQTVRDLAMVFVDRTPVWVMATSGGLQAYDAEWCCLGVAPGRYVRVSSIETEPRSVLAITDEGMMQCLSAEPGEDGQ